MTKAEQKEYLQKFVANQGTQMGLALAPLLESLIDNIVEPILPRVLQISPSAWVAQNSIFKYTVVDAGIKSNSMVVINFPNIENIATLDSAGFKHTSITYNNGSFVVYSETRPGALVTMSYKLLT